MGRYFALVLGALLILGDGCHKAIEAVENLTLSNDTLPKLLVTHYLSAKVSFSDLLLARDDQNLYGDGSDKRDTVLSSTVTDSYPLPSIYSFLKVDSSNVILFDSIPSLRLSGGYDQNFVELIFTNLHMSHLADSSLSCVLTGMEASGHITGMIDTLNTPHWLGSRSYYEKMIRKFWQCTSSTRIEITFPYKR